MTDHVSMTAAPAETADVTLTDTALDERPRAALALPRLSLETIVYLALILFALTVRLPDLGVIPLNDQEAHEALAVFRAIEPRAAGNPLVAHNPLMFSINALLMSAGGADNATTRLPTVLLGVLIVASPLLFRRWIGSFHALIMAVLLAISPVLLVASRTMSGAVWSLALAVLALYCIGRFIGGRRDETRSTPYAIAATIALFMLVLMAEPGGFLLFLSVTVGIGFALFTTDDPDHSYRRTFADTLRGWPWLRGVIAAGVAVALVAMVFLLYPQGLGNVGNALYDGLRGFWTRPAGYPFAYPLLTSLLYEPLLWLFGLVGAYLVLTRDSTFIQRAFVGWLVVSIVWSLIYAGAESSHALWLTVPLAGLAAVAVAKAVAPVQDRIFNVPTWGPWVHGIAVFATLCIAALRIIYVSGNIVGTAEPKPEQLVPLVFIIPVVMLIAITYFLVGSMWGPRAAWHGLGIGVLLFLGIYGLGSGWRAAVVNADDPREFWHVRPAARNLNLMLSTLTFASRRATGMPYDMQLVVLPPKDGPFDDGALAWALRNYFKTTFVVELGPGINAPVVIAPQSDEKPNLGAAYVGQDFPVYYTWDRRSLGWDWLAWVYNRNARVAPQAQEGRVIVWVRGDVYGVDEDSSSPTNLVPR
ncbi:MAG: hypothetical protein IT324_00145 [Anaerolineae bacterium]|nr:hypothetical protein [Anaerolineae bacterium]